MYDWGDLRVFIAIAVARAGSTLAAARELGVNQTTVARRIATLETALSARLFAPWLLKFMDLYPDIKVEVVATDQRLDLMRGEADVAVRAGAMPTDPGLVVRRFADYQWVMCCSSAYAEKHGAPTSAEALNDHFVIGSDGQLAKLAPHLWLTEAAPRAKRRSTCSSVANMVAAVKAGHGVGFVPNTFLAVETDLVECFPLPGCSFSFYLAMPEGMKDRPRVRALCDFLVVQANESKHRPEDRPATPQ